MYPEANTTNTCACIKAIPNSKPEKAIINAKGINPKIKKMKPLVIILYVKPAKMFNSMWPDKRVHKFILLSKKVSP